ncbi:Hypp1958 [Branchiostoma lanceolatum]|uniref:Hypp1958 protein n=1 Tax=Branchiostoma lanceolatum TaxID=7740 RepID=A0A8K0ER74_BRALA|nr:Hypp1958 [Branchiostoma lanceolatum]
MLSSGRVARITLYILRQCDGKAETYDNCTLPHKTEDAPVIPARHRGSRGDQVKGTRYLGYLPRFHIHYI